MSTRIERLVLSGRKLSRRVAALAAWDESKRTRGKTTPGSRGGSFRRATDKGGASGPDSSVPTQERRSENIPRPIDTFVLVKFSRKPMGVSDIAGAQSSSGSTDARIKVDKRLSSQEYDSFLKTPLSSRDWIATASRKMQESPGRGVIQVSAPGRRPLYIDPSGFDYARYIGFRN